jgi:ABC-type lipoprotein release transport system permease subunit
MTGQAITLAVGVLFFIRDVRSGWPFLLAPLSFGLNEGIRIFLTGRGLIDPLTQAVGGMSQVLTFVGTFALLLAFLAATALPAARISRLAPA